MTDDILFQGALLVNIARGGLINYESAYHNLESGHLGGLGIDVAWSEPFDPNDLILKFKNVIITPHVAGVTEYSYRSMAKVNYPRKRYTLNIFSAFRMKQILNSNCYKTQVVGDVALRLHEGLPLTGIEFVN